MSRHRDHGPTTVANHGDKGGFGRGDFGPGPARSVVPHVIQHPSRQSAPEEDLGAEPLPPELLVGEVKVRLERESLEDHDIIVRRSGRRIFLEGAVPSERELTLAEIVARGTPGVTEVRSSLRVA